MFEAFSAFFEGDAVFVSVSVLLLGMAVLMLSASKLLKLITSSPSVNEPEPIEYVDTDYQAEDTTEYFTPPEQMDTYH